MKTAMKFTAIAVVTVLVALSCAPEVELSSRDYGEYNDAKNAKYVSSAPGATDIYISAGSRFAYSVYGVTALPERYREIDIEFPNDADLVKVSNDNITEGTAEMKKFFTFHTYTNPDTSSITDPPYTPSNLGSAIDYKFVERKNVTTSSNTGKPATVITVRLNSVPNENTIVYRVNAAEYRRSGQLVDRNGDGIGGDELGYDDEYDEIEITGSITPAATAPQYNDFVGPLVTVYVNVGFGIDGYGMGIPVAGIDPVVVASLYSFNGNGAQERQILNDIKGKFEIQKYTNNVWAKDTSSGSAIQLYDASTLTPPAYATSWDNCLYAGITPDDLGIYRIKASESAVSLSSQNVGKGKAKIIIGNSALQNTFTTDPVLTYKDGREWHPGSFNNVVITSDNSKKNVVIKMYVPPYVYTDIDPTLSFTAYPQTMTTEAFNKAVKLLSYKPGTNGTITFPITANTENVAEIEVTNVVYSIDKRFDDSAVKNNLITITLDPDYVFESARPIRLLINSNFKFDNANVTFGDNCPQSPPAGNRVQDTFYDGTYLWKSYGNWSATSFPAVVNPPAPTPPDAPASVSATVSGNNISVTWGAVTGATSYRVYRAVGNYANPYNYIATATSNSFTDTTGVPTLTYYYKVSAVKDTPYYVEGDKSSSYGSNTLPWGTGPSSYYALSENNWKDDSIDNAYDIKWYSITLSADTDYYIWWNDSYEGDNTKTLDIAVSAYYSDGSVIFSNQDSAWTSYVTFTDSTSAYTTVYLKVSAYSYGTGTYAIAYATRDNTGSDAVPSKPTL